MALESSPIAHRTRSQNQGLVKSSTEIDANDRHVDAARNLSFCMSDQSRKTQAGNPQTGNFEAFRNFSTTCCDGPHVTDWDRGLIPTQRIHGLQRDLKAIAAYQKPDSAPQQPCGANGTLLTTTTLLNGKARADQQQQQHVRSSSRKLASGNERALPSTCETAAKPSEREIAAAVAARCRLNGKADWSKLMATLVPQTHVAALAAVASVKLPSGPEPVAAEVLCPANSDLRPLKEPQKQCQEMQEGLKSKDWVEICNSLTIARRVVAYHHHLLLPTLDTFVAALLLAVKSLRSSVCKAAIMCSAETFCIFGGAMADLIDGAGMAAPQTSLLQQLLLKAASNDKRFVVDEAQAATAAFAQHVPPQQALEMLLPYTSHKSPKVRGQTAKTLAIASVAAGPQQLQKFGTGRLLEACGRLVSDNTPEARCAARDLLRCVKAAWQCSSGSPSSDHSDTAQKDCRHISESPGKENEAKDALYEQFQPQGKVSSVLVSRQIGDGHSATEPSKTAKHRDLPSKPFCPADDPVLGVSGEDAGGQAAQAQLSEEKWATFCRSHLNAITTTAVLRATGT